MNLQDFYNNTESFLSKLNENGKELSFLNPEYKFEIGNPVGIPNMTLARMYELLLTSVVHLCPNKLMGTSMAIGDFFSGNGQELLMPNMNVCITNFIHLHLGRSVEDSLSSWELIKEEAYALAKDITSYLETTENKELNSELGSFYAYAGFKFVGTPSKSYIDTITKMVNSESLQPIADKVKSLIEMCEPYVNIADDLMNMRSLLQSKGVVEVYKGMLKMSAPSASGGACWATMMPSDDLHVTIPSANNMVMVLSSSGALVGLDHFGPSSSVPRVGFGTFLLPLDLVTEIQKIMDASGNNFTDYSVSLSDDRDIVVKKAMEWRKIQIETLQDYFKSNLLNLIGNNILGSLVKVDDESKTIYFSPIVPSSMLDGYTSEFKIMNFDAVLADYGSSAGLPSSVFGQEIPEDKIIAFAAV